MTFIFYTSFTMHYYGNLLIHDCAFEFRKLLFVNNWKLFDMLFCDLYES